jgi:hypothetical protein
VKRLVEFPLEAGGSILVEVEEVEPEGGLERVSRPGEVAEKARQTFEAALETVKPAAQAIIAKVRSLSDLPDEVQIEFGLKMTAQAGAVVASAGMEANYKVTLTWKREKKERPKT